MSCEIVFYAFFVCGHYCLQIGFIKVCIFYSIFCKSSFSCFCDFCVFCLFCVEFDENVVNFITLYNPCLYRCQVHCDFLSLCQNNWYKKISRHINLIIDSPYKTCLQRGLELINFVHKEECGTLTK